MALAMDTGRVIWKQQVLSGDAWNVGCLEPGRSKCPETAGPDHDFGSAPALVTLQGKRIVLGGQKSGQMHAFDADSGEPMWHTQVGAGGVLGGIEWGFATDGSKAYVALSNALEKKPGDAGGIVALNVADGKQRWSTPPAAASVCEGKTGCSTAQPAAVTAIPGVVFSGSLDGHLRAYEAETGQIIFDVDTAKEFATVNQVAARGGSMNGPGATVAGGTVFVSSGYGSLGFMPGNVLLAFTVDGK
jgi:polyvinyl alcohol dehydrogenase (cytochrome)